MKFPHEEFLEQFKVAVGEGAVVELKLRLLADKLPSLQRYAHAEDLKEIETEIANHFANTLSHNEKKALELCRQLRNKILHCNFSVARKKLEELEAEPQSAGVRKLDIASLSASEMRAKAKHGIAQGQGSLVSDTPTKRPGSIFGWLIEAGSSGDFQKAATVFRNAVAIVDRLAIGDNHA